MRPKILSFNTIFPSPGEEGHGLFVRLFVRARHLATAQLAEIHVLNPVPVVEYGDPAHTLTPFLDVHLLRADAHSRSWDRDAIARHGQFRDWTQTAPDVTALWLESIQEAAR